MPFPPNQIGIYPYSNLSLSPPGTDLGPNARFTNSFNDAVAPPPPSNINPSIVVARGAMFDTPLVSKLPVTRSLSINFRAEEPQAYFPNRNYPANNAQVSLLRAADPRELLLPRRGLVAVKHSLATPPMFAANADGAGRPALKFSAALQTALDITPVIPTTRTNDAELSLFAVFRLGSAVTNTRRLFSFFRSSEPTTNFSVAAILVTSTSYILFINQNFNTAGSPGTVTVAVVPNTGENICVVGRHGSVANSRITTMWVRAGGVTTTVSNTTTLANLAWGAAGSWLDTAILGWDSRVATSWSDEYLFEMAAWSARIDDTEKDALIAYAQAEYGVA